MSHELFTALPLSLALTLALEAVFFFITGKRDKKDFLLMAAVNVITNPTVVLLYWMAVSYLRINTLILITLLEAFAVITEGRYYSKYSVAFSRPYLFSLAANAFSFSIGVLLQSFIL